MDTEIVAEFKNLFRDDTSSLVNIENIFHAFWGDNVFDAIEALPPKLAARIQLKSSYKEDFIDNFRYPGDKIAELARFCVRYNNAKLLSIFQNFEGVPEKYIITFFENESNAENSSELIAKKMSEYLYRTDNLIVNAYI